MSKHAVFAGVVALVLLAAAPGRAEVKVVTERLEGEAATGAFAFKSVPAPSKTDAANQAKLALVTGQRDDNGGELETLRDGKLPREEDQPDANFFFAAGTDGGRLWLDLGEAIEIKQVNTYSWHAGGRGPQVYKLYASDGSAAGFDARPGRTVDPEKAGWKLVAAVDTRPKEGRPGGQYGVSIADAAGALGKYRYLLFAVARTDPADRFGLTFFSEIDVIDGKEHPAPVAAAPAERVVIKVTGAYEMEFDISETPELKEWVETKLKPVCEQWYPKLVEMLPDEGYTAPKRFSVTFKKDMQGVAYTAGTRVVCAAPWFKRNLDGEAVGAVVHELVHVVQQYGRARGGARNPGWLVEGLTDYIRWFLYEPASKRPRPDPARAKYTDSYRTTAAFLDYVLRTHDKELIKKLNTAMRAGKYSPDLWKQWTDKTIDELWADYIKTLEKK